MVNALLSRAAPACFGGGPLGYCLPHQAPCPIAESCEAVHPLPVTRRRSFPQVHQSWREN